MPCREAASTKAPCCTVPLTGHSLEAEPWVQTPRVQGRGAVNPGGQHEEALGEMEMLCVSSGVTGLYMCVTSHKTLYQKLSPVLLYVSF